MKVKHLALPAATALCVAAWSVNLWSQEPPGRGGAIRALPVMQALDTDGDGELSAKEIENASAALRTLDKDKNGKLTADELRPNIGRDGRGLLTREAVVTQFVNRMMEYDKNGDGKLSSAELPDRMKSLMDRADANKDGFVDRAELTKLTEEQLPLGPGGGGRGGPGRGPREPAKDRPRG
jgi:Ca2+-binding EF-hand superfamily protein